jgi:hypothetical protein
VVDGVKAQPLDAVRSKAAELHGTA